MLDRSETARPLDLGGVDLSRKSLIRRHLWLRFAPAVMLALGMRARFISTPMTSDEGGFLAVARAWASGARLYDDVWVDRPQGLILLYRVLDFIGLGSPAGVRILAAVACIVGAVSSGVIAERLFGMRAGMPTATIGAAFASVPQYEGFIANGELLSSAAGALGLALALCAVWRRPLPSFRLLALGGAFGGAAISLKQSGFDAFVAAAAAVLTVCLVRSAWSTRQRLTVPLTFAGGFAVVLGALVVHGTLTGFDRFWYAVYGYRMGARSALADPNWTRLATTWNIAKPVLLPAGIICLTLAACAWRARRRDGLIVAWLWLVAASIAFLIGGQFHRHYWVIFAFPLAVLAAGVVATLDSVGWRRVMVAALLASPITLTVQSLSVPRHEVGRAFSDDGRLIKDERIAAWFRTHARPDDSIYALCASAALYGNVPTESPYPYLWFDAVAHVPGGRSRIAEMLASPQAPRFVALYQNPANCDSSGALDRVVADRYRRATTIDGIAVLELTGTRR